MIHDEDSIDTTDPSFVQNFQGFINPSQGTSNEETSAMSVPYYLAEFIGVGEGCDYTIGCNRTSMVFEADSIENAPQALMELVGKEYNGFTGLHEIYGMYDITIYEIGKTPIKLNMKECLCHEKEAWVKRRNEQMEREQREMYERLKKKYGDA